MIDNVQNEILIITQEECAEVIQEISKIFRFGIDDRHGDNPTHRARLEGEVGDLLCMIDILIEHQIVDPKSIAIARMAKREKLHQYSNIFK